MKKLPVGIQSFKEVVEGGYLYADKTPYIEKLYDEAKYYFLSRPRRFGKSLLIDTMYHAFSGHKELFEGLYLYDSDFSFEEKPVIRIDFTQIENSTSEKLESGIDTLLDNVAKKYDVSLDGNFIVEKFISLITVLRDKFGKKVVLLIDEYDKPIIDHTDNKEQAEINRKLLGSFYGIIKGQDENIEFCFLTGVSKYTKLSLFSVLNNLTDITLKPKYAGICGITDYEFDELFGNRMNGFDRDRIFRWYDGYTWDGKTKVFNPFSLLNFFSDGRFNNYWYASGTPAFLYKVFKENPTKFLQVQEQRLSERVLDSYNIEDAPLSSLLFQTGFLTIKSIDDEERQIFNVGFPNQEVASSFSEQFVSSVFDTIDPLGLGFYKTISESLENGNIELLKTALISLYASIPHQLKNKDETYYHALFLGVMQLLGFEVIGELSSSRGRCDICIKWKKTKVFIIEMKYQDDGNNIDSSLQDALNQIDEKGYAEQFAGKQLEVHKWAVVVFAKGEVAVAS
jgi:hypothetical protein